MNFFLIVIFLFLNSFIVLANPKLFICHTDPNKIGGQCEYQIQHHSSTHDLVRDVKYAVDPTGDINAMEGYIIPSGDKHTIIFWHKDPQILESIKFYLLQLDQQRTMKDRKRVFVRLNYYFLSHKMAKTQGFNFDFLSSGVLSPDIERASGSGNNLDLNFGNLTKDILSLNLEYASDNGVLVNSETIEHFSYSGFPLTFSESMKLYREGSLSTDQETLRRRVNGQIILPDNDTSIHVNGLSFAYPIETNKENSLIIEKEFYGSYVKFESGIPYILVNQSINVDKSSYLNSVLGRQKIKEETKIQFIATMTFYRGKDILNAPEDVKFNKNTELYKYTTKELKNLNQGDRKSLYDVFSRENFASGILVSPFGNIANRLVIQFDKTVLTQNTAKAFVKLRIKGDGIKYNRTLKLENLAAGPYVLPAFDQAVFRRRISRNGKIKFSVEVSLDKDFRNTSYHKAIDPYKATYHFIYVPDISAIELVKSSIRKIQKGRNKRR